MTKKKIIGLCIGAVVLAVAAAGVKEGSKNESNQHEIASSEFPVKIKKELLADDKVWSRTTGTAKNQVHAEYLEGEDDMTVSFDVYYQCEGSCGEYFADITVTDSESGKLYYSSEAENEAAE